MPIIGIIGRRRVGKDTLADYINKNYEYKIKKFAQPMKDALKCLFDLTDQQLEGPEKDEIDIRWGVSPRKMMQFIGTEVLQFKLQELIPDIETKFAVKRMFIDNNSEDKIVISDVRFEHEVVELRKRGALLIKIVRNIEFTDSDNHISESGIDNLYADIVIHNNGTLNELFDQVKEITLCPLYKFMFLTDDLLN